MTDIAVLVVAADDGVMPQTEEAIHHIRSAGVPMVVAVNKVDKDGANPDRVLQQLAEHQVVPESYGGDVPVVTTSALTGQGIEDLLDTILLVSDVVSPPRANPDRLAVGTVIDSELERGRGPVATVLVQNGTLRIGDNVVVGRVYGKIRALTDDAGRRVKEAGPSKPVQITGLTDVATAGDILQVTETERAARTLAERRTADQRARVVQPVRRITLSDFAAVQGETKTMTLVLKAEANGSLEALRSQVTKLEDPNVTIKIVGEGVGAVGESDVNLAAVSGAIVIGFNVRPDERAKAAAEELGVDIRFYDVVYQVTDDIERSIKGMYEPTLIEVYQGRAEVRRVFRWTAAGDRRLPGGGRQDHPRRHLHRAPRRPRGGRGQDRRPQAVPGRRARGCPRVRMRHHPRGFRRLRRGRRHRGPRHRAAEPLIVPLTHAHPKERAHPRAAGRDGSSRCWVRRHARRGRSGSPSSSARSSRR